MTDDPRRPSLIDLFREEARTQARVLNDGLLVIDRTPNDATALEACMRAAHSLKGAARIVGVQVGVELAHAMEDCFVAAQEGRALLDAAWIDELLRGVDIVARIGNDEDESARDAVGACVAALQARMKNVPPHGAALRRGVAAKVVVEAAPLLLLLLRRASPSRRLRSPLLLLLLLPLPAPPIRMPPSIC